MIEVVTGNLFKATEKYLCHQTNCVTNRAAHLSKEVFEKFPHADIYTKREFHDQPGTIIVRGNGADQRYVINMLGQYYPGNPKFPEAKQDGTAARESYFLRCLGAVAKIEKLESVAFPWRIGCGAAGGDWDTYYQMIERFANYVGEKQSAKVVIYKLAES